MELRYDPYVKAFDRRGMLLEALNSEFSKKMKHWRTDGVAVILQNDNNTPTKQIFVDHQRSALIYEDPGSMQEFNDDGNKLIKILMQVFPDIFKTINRMGVRFITVHKDCGREVFSDLLENVKHKFFAKENPLTLNYIDIRVTLVHSTGQISIGPVRQGESWLAENFTKPEINDFKVGYGVDIDSYAINPKIQTDKDVSKLFYTTYDLSLITEGEVVSTLRSGDFHEK